MILLSGLLWVVACESDIDPMDDDQSNNPNNNPGNPVTNDPDEIAEYLMLADASKITGNLPAAPDGQLKINVKDTIYMAKGFPIGERLVVKHDGSYDITGVYVGIENSSFYYDVPVVEAEAQDSSDVIYLNLGDTEGFNWDFPFTLILLPHADGLPWDKFIRVVKIEDPEEDAGNSITVPKNFSLDLVHWEWIYTVMVDPSDPEGNVLHFEGKGVKKISAYQTGGCCNDDGTSTTVANDPYCFSKYSDGTPNPNWRSIDVSHYFMWAYDVLYLYNDGTFRQANTSIQTNYRPSLSDFCNNEAAYDFDISTFVKFGTHDFTPGANQIKFTYDVTDPPVFGKNIYGGELLYSSHNMLISFGSGREKWYFKYKRPVNGVSNPTELSLEGWD
jgi:hypothetical protein